MKILLIGHSIIDHIEEKGETKPGGVYYSVLGFYSSFKPDDHLTLITGKNPKYYQLFEPLYSNVDLTLFDETKDMPEVFLYTSGKTERREVYKNISGRLNVEKIDDFSFFDGIMINMTTGFDITIDQLKWIRSKYRSLIYIDIHSLSRGIDEFKKREFRKIPQVEEWLSCIDIMQCNESELKTICDLESEEANANWIINKGVKTVIITKAQNGVSLYNNEIGKLCLNAEKINVKNKIGCGDIFGATFFYSYIGNNDIRNSLYKANHAGSVAASIENLSKYMRIIL